MPEYTVAAVAACIAVVTLERRWLRTGLLRTRSYLVTMAICLLFMIPVDGWLTKRSSPIVRYDAHAILGLRAPWDIPVEDYLFGFALLTLVLLLWERARQAQLR
jgi:lycopene cyclase domain-containing protein